ncbi:MAG: universal stress protein [Sulfuricella sp.]|nr:universal stress protein [Gammaproteobacteria bacterium]
MYKHILVAVDGSDTSDRALHEAINLAKDQQAILRIVYAVDEVNINVSPEFPNPTEIEQAWTDAGREILDKAQNSARAAGIKAETRLLEIDKLGVRTADAIIQEAKTWPADLLVAGTHGRSGLSHLLMGSVAEGIVRICPVPILLIRAKQ